jgi:hypothetical protein
MQVMQFARFREDGLTGSTRVPFGVKKLGAACGIMITGHCIETLYPYDTDGVTQPATIPR